MVKMLYRLFMYIWTGNAAVYTVIAFQYNIAEALVLAIVCVFASWIFWLCS